MRFWFRRTKSGGDVEAVGVQTLEPEAPEAPAELRLHEKEAHQADAANAPSSSIAHDGADATAVVEKRESSFAPEELPISKTGFPTAAQGLQTTAPPKPAAEPLNPNVPPELNRESSTAELHTDSVDWKLEEKLASHKEWVESFGATGHKADFAAGKLAGAELVGVNLRHADLQDADLEAADLLLADLRDACLVRANLQEACLVGANLEGANLEDARLETAMGLVPRQLAGANLRDASLPPHVREFPAYDAFGRVTQTVVRLFNGTLFVLMVAWLMIWKTRDIQLVTNSAILPFLKSASAAAAIPTSEIFLLASGLLLTIYLIFLFHLQRLWDAVLELPSVFPDGRELGESHPWIVTGLLRLHFRWMNRDAPSTRIIEKFISAVLAYWIVPVTLLAFWGRYLTAQDMHGTALQVLFIVAAAAAALYATTKVGRPQTVWSASERTARRIFRNSKLLSPTSFGIGLTLFLMLLSLGTIKGAPHDTSRAPQIPPTDIRRWAASFFWSLGFDPYADLTEVAISNRPPTWTVTDDQVSNVRGAHLNNSKFRYAQGYGIFLANARLWRSDFQGAFLSESDFRNADLGQSNLSYAILDRALLGHANLDRAVLDNGNLTRADLRGANMSYASALNATLVDARLDGVSLYTARLAGASLIRATLEKADLRDAHLERANLEHADLQQAYLWSAKLPGANLQNAQLQNALFIEADLRGADLRGAEFSGTVLTGADLQDSNLDSTDMRGALRLSAAQVCSARSRGGTLLDDTLQLQVDALCGAIH